jgi:hypothetical protein
MFRTLASLTVAVATLVGPADSVARGVHFGLAPPASTGRWTSGGAGFLGRHSFFSSLGHRGLVFVLYDGPYAVYYPPDPFYLAPR